MREPAPNRGHGTRADRDRWRATGRRRTVGARRAAERSKQARVRADRCWPKGHDAGEVPRRRVRNGSDPGESNGAGPECRERECRAPEGTEHGLEPAAGDQQTEPPGTAAVANATPHPGNTIMRYLPTTSLILAAGGFALAACSS